MNVQEHDEQHRDRQTEGNPQRRRDDAAPDKEAVDDMENACVRLRVYGKRRADDEPE